MQKPCQLCNFHHIIFGKIVIISPQCVLLLIRAKTQELLIETILYLLKILYFDVTRMFLNLFPNDSLQSTHKVTMRHNPSTRPGISYFFGQTLKLPVTRETLTGKTMFRYISLYKYTSDCLWLVKYFTCCRHFIGHPLI